MIPFAILFAIVVAVYVGVQVFSGFDATRFDDDGRRRS